MDAARRRLGAHYHRDRGTEFLVWAPHAQRVRVHLVSPVDRYFRLKQCAAGYFAGCEAGVLPGALYFYQLDGKVERPDPTSRFQPEGVHGPSQVVTDDFAWRDNAWVGLELAEYALYELHVGTFTAEGTFDSIVPELPSLVELGITAVELMPVGQFPGSRNWGYDGTYPFAAQNTYGGPDALKRLIDACHAHELAVVLDVVYNHVGPEGNYLSEFGHYFTDRYRTNWGSALNFDGPACDPVRRFFIENALMWIDEFHVDALRLDAVHAIFDCSARPFLRELAAAVHRRAAELGRRVYLIAETNLNDPRLLEPVEQAGYGLDAQWLDDFQRAAHAMLTGEKQGYYCDFGGLEQLEKSLAAGYVLDGCYSHYRRRQYGAPSRHLEPTRFIAFTQNHDQVGNRGGGERLGHLVNFEQQKLAAALVVLGPYLPLLFMGEEYGETSPFHYFISHLDPALVEAVCRGRARDLANFQQQFGAPDPQAENTFLRSRLDRSRRFHGNHAVLWSFYRELLRLRKRFVPLRLAPRAETRVLRSADALLILRSAGGARTATLLNFGDTATTVDLTQSDGGEGWELCLDSSVATWGGPREAKSQGQATLTSVDMAPHAAVLLSLYDPSR